tara:strand:+ start:61 stop:1002 length:942 start_codon:yes stop_codon:yes gene_type:complete
MKCHVLVAVVVVAFALICWQLFPPNVLLPLPPLCDKVINGQRVIICGASEGIGRDIALQYSQCGAHIAIASRRAAVLAEVKRECEERGAASVLAVAVDLATTEGAQELISSSVAHFASVAGAPNHRGIDVLILNHIKPFFDHWDDIEDPISTTQKIVEVNVLSYVYLTQYALPYLRALDEDGLKGSIGVISSQAGKMGLPQVAPYSLSKHALHGFFDSLRLDITNSSNPNVDITICVLGSIDTKNARENTEGKLAKKNIKQYPSEECASAIIRGVANHAREIYYPHFELQIVNLLRPFLPGTIDQMILYLLSE